MRIRDGSARRALCKRWRPGYLNFKVFDRVVIRLQDLDFELLVFLHVLENEHLAPVSFFLFATIARQKDLLIFGQVKAQRRGEDLLIPLSLFSRLRISTRAVSNASVLLVVSGSWRRVTTSIWLDIVVMRPNAIASTIPKTAWA